MDPREPGRPARVRQAARGRQSAPHRGRRRPPARQAELDPQYAEGLERAAARGSRRVPAAEKRGHVERSRSWKERDRSAAAPPVPRAAAAERSTRHMMESKAIWMNGELVPFREAKIHFLTPALHYGVSAFEGIRCYRTSRGPAVFRLREHVERLVDSARIMGWRELPFSADELVDACRKTIRANGFEECYVRPLIYLAEGGWNLTVDAGKAHVGIAVWEWKQYLGAEAAEQGVRANISSYTRHHPNIMMTKAKIGGNYPNSVLAKTESLRLGFEEAIMLDSQGHVAECTGENLFLVRRGNILTPPDMHVLHGLTRDTLLHLPHDLGSEVSSH